MTELDEMKVDLEQANEDLKALTSLTQKEKQDFAGKTENQRKQSIVSRSNKYIRELNNIRQLEIEIANLEGTTPPKQYSEGELKIKQSELTNKLNQSLQDIIQSRTIAGATKDSPFHEKVRMYLKEASAFNPNTNNSISFEDLFSRKFDEIGVKNIAIFPKDEVDELRRGARKDASIEVKNFISNLDLLEEASEEKRTSQEKEFSIEGSYEINVSKFFGALDLSDMKSRDATYDYWKKIHAKYADFKTALDAFLDAYDEDEGKDERKKEFLERLKSFKKYKTIDLQYVYSIEPIEHSAILPKQKLLNALNALVEAENLFDYIEERVKASKDTDEDKDDEDEDDDWEAKDIMAAFEEVNTYIEEDKAWRANERDAYSMDEQTTDDSISISQTIETEEERRMLQALSYADVDILLAIELIQNKKIISVTKEMKNELRTALKNIRQMLSQRKLMTIEQNLSQWEKEINNSLSLTEREDYYVPVSVMPEEIFKKIPELGEYNPNEIVDKINKFFTDLEELLKDWQSQNIYEYRPRTGQAQTGFEEIKNPNVDVRALLSASNTVLRPSRKPIPQYLLDQKEALTKLIEAINNYFVNPITSGRMPIAIPDYARRLGFREVNNIAESLNIETTMGRAYVRATTDSVATIGVDDIEALTSFFGDVFTKGVKAEKGLIESGQRAVKALNEIFGAKESNANYISAVIYDIMNETNDFKLKDSKIKSSRSSRKTIEERNKQFEEDYQSGKSFSVFGLPLYLDENEGMFSQHPDKKMKSAYDALVNVIKQQGNDITVMLKALLEAHDAIRKALGKEVQYGFIPLSDYNSVMNYLDGENFDLTTFEIENIVKSYDSHKNIGNEYGISDEDVYLIKANFR